MREKCLLTHGGHRAQRGGPSTEPATAAFRSRRAAYCEPAVQSRSAFIFLHEMAPFVASFGVSSIDLTIFSTFWNNNCLFSTNRQNSWRTRFSRAHFRVIYGQLDDSDDCTSASEEKADHLYSVSICDLTSKSSSTLCTYTQNNGQYMCNHFGEIRIGGNCEAGSYLLVAHIIADNLSICAGPAQSAIPPSNDAIRGLDRRFFHRFDYFQHFPGE